VQRKKNISEFQFNSISIGINIYLSSSNLKKLNENLDGINIYLSSSNLKK